MHLRFTMVHALRFQWLGPAGQTRVPPMESCILHASADLP